MVSARSRFEELSPTVRRRLVLGALAGLLAVAAVLALGQAGRVRSQMIDDATASAGALVDAALVPELTAADASAPALGERYATLAIASEQIRADGTVASVTIWAGDGTVLFADDVSLVGDQVRAMRATVLGVIGDEARSGVFRGLVRSFVPVELAPGVSVAVEVDRYAGPIASATDPWRLMALLAAAGAMLLGLLLARTFTRAGRRAEGFDEETLRAALIGRRRAERAYGEAVEKAEALGSELERTRQALRETEERARESARTADDTPRLREHLTLTAEDLQRVEQERDALRERLHETGRAVEAEAARGREELAGALAEIERLEGVKLSLQERAAKAEDAAAHLTKQVADLQARPDIEAELVSVRRHAEATQRELAESRQRAEAAERRNADLEDVADQLRTRVNDLERRPDLSAKLDAATAALDIAREQIRALSARTGEADAEAAALRTELEEMRTARSTELDDARHALSRTQRELEVAGREMKSVVGENGALRDEVESLRREADAAGELVASAKAELLQTTEHASALKAQAKDAEDQLDRERAAMAIELDQQRADAAAELERVRVEAAEELERVRVEAAEELERVRVEAAQEMDTAVAGAAAIAEELEARRAELGRALEDRDAATAARASAVRERDALVAERDHALQARKKATAGRDAAVAERDVVAAEREALAADLDAAVAERRALEIELEAEREAVRAELARAERLQAERDVAQAEAERLRGDLDGALSEADEAARALDATVASTAREAAARAESEAERERLAARVGELEQGLARALAEAAVLETTGRDELERARAQVVDLRAQVAAEHAEAERRLTDSERRIAEAELAVKTAERARDEAERARDEAEATAVEVSARADEAEERLADTEARFHRTRFTEALGAGPDMLVSEPDGLAVEIRSETPAATANGSTPRANGTAANAARPAMKVEVDTLVRRVVQESWSERGRMVSVYAEPVTVEAPTAAIEEILGALLERSVSRTSEGNRIVVHVERVEDGVLISVEDGRPPADDAAMAETNRLAGEIGGWARVEGHLGGGSISRVHLPASAHAGAAATG